MGDYEQAVRHAQAVLRAVARAQPQQEYGYNQWGESKKAKYFKEAADLIGDLIVEEEQS